MSKSILIVLFILAGVVSTDAQSLRIIYKTSGNSDKNVLLSLMKNADEKRSVKDTGQDAIQEGLADMISAMLDSLVEHREISRKKDTVYIREDYSSQLKKYNLAKEEFIYIDSSKFMLTHHLDTIVLSLGKKAAVYQIDSTMETKEILGYTCKKIVISEEKDGEKTTCTMWVTSKILPAIPPMAVANLSRNLLSVYTPLLIIEESTLTEGMKITTEAIRIIRD